MSRANSSSGAPPGSPGRGGTIAIPSQPSVNKNQEGGARCPSCEDRQQAGVCKICCFTDYGIGRVLETRKPSCQHECSTCSRTWFLCAHPCPVCNAAGQLSLCGHHTELHEKHERVKCDSTWELFGEDACLKNLTRDANDGVSWTANKCHPHLRNEEWRGTPRDASPGGRLGRIHTARESFCKFRRLVRIEKGSYPCI